MAWWLILILQVFITNILTGISWSLQLVHYPLFNYVDRDKFCDFIKKHQKRLSFVLVPLMIAECFLSILMLVVAQPGKATVFASILFALVIVIWFSTFCFQVAEHCSLNKGFCHKSLKKLIASNWIRTFAWTARALLLFFLLFQR